MHKRLLSNDFYAKLDEHTDDLPAQTISMRSRKLQKTNKSSSVSEIFVSRVISHVTHVSQIVSYELSGKQGVEDDPLFSFVRDASIESRRVIGKRVKQAAKEHCQLNRKLGKRYLNK